MAWVATHELFFVPANDDGVLDSRSLTDTGSAPRLPGPRAASARRAAQACGMDDGGAPHGAAGGSGAGSGGGGLGGFGGSGGFGAGGRVQAVASGVRGGGAFACAGSGRGFGGGAAPPGVGGAGRGIHPASGTAAGGLDKAATGARAAGEGGGAHASPQDAEATSGAGRKASGW